MIEYWLYISYTSILQGADFCWIADSDTLPNISSEFCDNYFEKLLKFKWIFQKLIFKIRSDWLHFWRVLK